MRRTAIASIVVTAIALAYELALWNTDLHQWSFLHWLNSIPQLHGMIGIVDFLILLAIGTVLATIAVIGGAVNRKASKSLRLPVGALAANLMIWLLVCGLLALLHVPF
jgi:hypothetical protein